MAVLKYLGALDACPLSPGQPLRLPEQEMVVIGSGEEADLRICVPSIAKKHARIEQIEDGKYCLQALAKVAGSYLDGRALSRHESPPLSDGCVLRLGNLQFSFVNSPSRELVSQVRRLREWWDRAEEAPEVITPANVTAVGELYGTTCLASGRLTIEEAMGWYQSYRGDRQRSRLLPIAVPHLVDLAACVLFGEPPLRAVGRILAACDPQSVRVRYYKAYQQRYLCSLAFHPQVRFVRDRVSSLRRNSSARPDIVTRFLARIFEWVTNAWYTVDVETEFRKQLRDLKGTEQEVSRETANRARQEAKQLIAEDRDHCAGGESRILLDPADVQAFLIQTGEIIRRARAMEKVLDPVERFLLGARSEVASAFDHHNTPLLAECVATRPLEDRDFEVEPLDREPQVPEIPSRDPGDESAIVRIRTTKRLEDLPQVVPSDLCMLYASEDGEQRLLEKMMNEGLLKFERHDYDTEIRRERFLVCLIADTGPQSWVTGLEGGDVFGDVLPDNFDRVGNASRGCPQVHAQRLIFEILRDLTFFVRLPNVVVDLHFFLQSVGGSALIGGHYHHPLHCATTLAELQRKFGKSKYEDMIQLERLAVGYFFPTAGRARRQSLLPVQLIHRVFQSGNYDLTLFVFLGPRQTLSALLPAELPPPRKRPGVKDVVMMAQLGPWPTSVEVATAESFDEMTLAPDFQSCFDDELRYRILEALLGKRRNGSITETELAFRE